jgi:hypothetical protein
MHRLFRLAIAMLSLALGVTAAGAQESPRPMRLEGQDAGARASAGPREVRPRESLMQRGRDVPEMPRRAEPQPLPPQSFAGHPPRQDPRSISEAVRRVQRTTGGQILGAEQVPFEGRNITRVKYMDDRGRVRYMDDPGASERRAPRRADNDTP